MRELRENVYLCHKNTTVFSHIDSKHIRAFTAGTSEVCSAPGRGMLALSLPVQDTGVFNQRPFLRGSFCVSWAAAG